MAEFSQTSSLIGPKREAGGARGRGRAARQDTRCCSTARCCTARSTGPRDRCLCQVHAHVQVFIHSLRRTGGLKGQPQPRGSGAACLVYAMLLSIIGNLTRSNLGEDGDGDDARAASSRARPTPAMVG